VDQVDHRAHTYIPLWRNWDFVIRFSGQIVSTVGSRVSGIALPLLVLALTRSAAQAGIVGALDSLPVLILGLPAGALIDRWNRKAVMMVSDAGRGLNLGSIALALAFGHLTITQLYINAILDGILSPFFFLSIQASTRQIVPKEQLGEASSLDQAAVFSIGLFGPALGGLLYGIGEATPFLVDAVSYVASVISLAFIRRELLPGQRHHERPGMWLQIREGFSWLAEHRVVQHLTLLSGALMVIRSGASLVLIVLARDLRASPVEVGLIFSVQAIGGIIGSIVGSRIQARFTVGSITLTTIWIYALLWPLLVVARNPLALGFVAAGWTLVLPGMQAVQTGYRLLLIPDELQGRLNSIFRLVHWGVQAIGPAMVGIVFEVVSRQHAVGVMFLAAVLVALYASLTPSLRRAPRIGDLRPA